MELDAIRLYKSGMSIPEVGKFFSVSGATIHNTLKKHDIDRRSVSEGNSLKWKNDDFRKNQVEKRTDKPSGALGKNWSVDHVVKKPNMCGNKNRFWKGGKTKLYDQIKNTAEYSF
ncbi:MAG: hypothetical protein U9N09_09020, partial [Euryarchaeota archaeon]|nr:hypothetical protein [Euryarchaeota archaeon]